MTAGPAVTPSFIANTGRGASSGLWKKSRWTDMVKVRVSCYAGYRGEETPSRFWLGERTVEVLAVEDRWLAPEHRYFKVRGDDGGRYILRHDPRAWHWELVFFQSI
jgi:hypothetical protein